MNIKTNMILITFLAIFLLHFYDGIDACDSDCAALSELEAEANSCACQTGCPLPCIPIIPTTTIMPTLPPAAAAVAMALAPALMAAAAATGRSATSAIFAAAFKKLKKQKKMEKKMIKAAYKRGKKSLMIRAMTGQLPSPTDFLNSRDEFSVFEFPNQYGQIEFPSLIPGPSELGINEYLKLFKQINKIKDVEIEKKKKFFKKKIIKKWIKKETPFKEVDIIKVDDEHEEH